MSKDKSGIKIEKKSFMIRLEKELDTVITKEAKKNGLSKNKLISRILTDHLIVNESGESVLVINSAVAFIGEIVDTVVRYFKNPPSVVDVQRFTGFTYNKVYNLYQQKQGTLFPLHKKKPTHDEVNDIFKTPDKIKEFYSDLESINKKYKQLDNIQKINTYKKKHLELVNQFKDLALGKNYELHCMAIIDSDIFEEIRKKADSMN